MHWTFRTKHTRPHTCCISDDTRVEITQIFRGSIMTKEKKKICVVGWLSWFLLCFALYKQKMTKKYRWTLSIFHLAPRTVLFVLVAMLATIKAGNILLLTLSGPLFLIGYRGTSIWVNIKRVIFMIWGRGGSNSVGSSKKIILAPHTWLVFG